MKILRKFATLAILVAGIATIHADTSPFRAPGTAEMQVRANEVDQQIKGDYRYVLGLQAQARKQKDVIKLNCVNDKLVQIKAEMNIVDSARQQLMADIAIGQKLDRETWYDQMMTGGSQIRNLRQQAAACLGEIELSTQELGATSTHPDFPDDPTVIPFDVYTEPPAYASPFN